MGVGPLPLLGLLEVGVGWRPLGPPGLSLCILSVHLVCDQICHKYRQVTFPDVEAISHLGMVTHLL